MNKFRNPVFDILADATRICIERNEVPYFRLDDLINFYQKTRGHSILK